MKDKIKSHNEKLLMLGHKVTVWWVNFNGRDFEIFIEFALFSKFYPRKFSDILLCLTYEKNYTGINLTKWCLQALQEQVDILISKNQVLKYYTCI